MTFKTRFKYYQHLRRSQPDLFYSTETMERMKSECSKDPSAFFGFTYTNSLEVKELGNT